MLNLLRSTHHASSAGPARGFRWPLIAVAIAHPGLASSARAQCAADINRELSALMAVRDQIVALGFPKVAAPAGATPAPTNASSAGASSPSSPATSGPSTNGTAASSTTASTTTASTTTAAGGAATWNRVRGLIENGTAFFPAVAASGPAAACLVERHDVFRSATLSTLRRGLSDTSAISEDALRRAVEAGAAALFSSRYQSTDRVGVLFGIGMSLLRRGDADQHKVVTRQAPGATGTGGATTPPATQQFIVEDSDSRLFPNASTGIAVRFRDRVEHYQRWSGPVQAKNLAGHMARNASFLMDLVVPTTVFGSVQFGGNGSTEGPVSGTALGLGWRVVGDVNVLFGYSATRIKELRRDLRQSFDARGDGVLPLPAGESESSILGAGTADGWLFALAVPVGLRSVFGVGK